ncbi:FAD binding domain-containing protein [Neobacillus terrae]|uniref:FAD binding domain-containing protein n=1 Tax=Neobacillus terrae TaxID=3034837 RepID=UPI0014072594|nr:xanthine dehydrogenase [Neobacillus terrae]
MISFDFDYLTPTTMQEAAELFQRLDQEGKSPYYYSGGTELITLGRLNMAYSEAVIDLKNIPECHAHGLSGDFLVQGSALSLTAAEVANFFPFLTSVASQVADHTARGKITIGGNICAAIFYREAVLPYLLVDSTVIIAGNKGITAKKMSDAFKEKIQLKKGEFLVQLLTERKWLNAPFIHIKRRQQWQTGYPLITIAALQAEDGLRVGLSGLCPFPFRSAAVEAALNKKEFNREEKIREALKAMPSPILDDVEGSKEYRLFALRNLLEEILNWQEGGFKLENT